MSVLKVKAVALQFALFTYLTKLNSNKVILIRGAVTLIKLQTLSLIRIGSRTHVFLS